MLIKWEKYRYLGRVKRHRKNFTLFPELFLRSKRNDFDDTQVEIAYLVNNGHPTTHRYLNISNIQRYIFLLKKRIEYYNQIFKLNKLQPDGC